MKRYKIITIIGWLLIITACNLSSGFGFRIVKGSGDVITESRDVSGFFKLDVCCGMELNIAQGERESLQLEGDDNILAEIVTRVVDSRLTINFQDNNSVNYQPTQPINVFLEVIDIEEISISGGGNLASESIISDQFDLMMSGGSDANLGSLEASNLEINLSGGGDIEAALVLADLIDLDLSGGSDAAIDELIAEILRIGISGGGSAQIKGTAGDSDIDLGGGSSFEGPDLLSQNTIFSCSGGGKSFIWVEETLEANLSGGCFLRYYGQPEIVEQTLSGGSELISLGER